MKKLVCPACGLTNLEKFVSFPHCAACGALLPRPQAAPWRAFWKRPVGTIYFALAIGGGLGALALGVISITGETRQRAARPLLVYPQLARELAPGATGIATLTLDSAEDPPEAAFEQVQLRLSRETLRDFKITSLTPAPQQIERRGSGRYYLWDELRRGTAVKLSFRARPQPQVASPQVASPQVASPRVARPQVLQLRLALGATGYVPFELRSTVRVRAPKSGQVPPKVSRY